MAKKVKYYNIAHLAKDYPDALYYVVFGERSNGKTYSALDYALERYFKHGEQFAYIRRFGEDVKKKNLSTLFDAHIVNGRIESLSGGLYNSVDYTIGRFIPCLYTEDAGVEKSPEPAGFAFDLNAMEHHKSTSYPKVTTVIFDEFLSRQGYLTNEFVLFMNTLSTIIRDRSNVKIFMIGNTVNKYCPYFAEMGLTHVKDQKPGTIDLYNYSDTGLSVAVEYCDSMAKHGGKKSDKYFAFDNPQLKMITSGSWEIAIYPHLTERYRPKDIVYQFFIVFDDTKLHCEIVSTDSSYFLFVHPKTTEIKDDDNDIVYTNIPSQKWNRRIGLTKLTDRLSRVVCRLIAENRVFYSDNETGEVLRNFILWSTQYSGVKGGS